MTAIVISLFRIPLFSPRASRNQTAFSTIPIPGLVIPTCRTNRHFAISLGSRQFYVSQAFPGPGGKWQVSNEGGSAPLWARNGKQLFCRSSVQSWQAQVRVVDVQIDGGLRTNKPRLLCKTTGFQFSGYVRSWDISLDGQKFLIVKLDDRKLQPTTEMILVQSWFEGLKRLCPAK